MHGARETRPDPSSDELGGGGVGGGESGSDSGVRKTFKEELGRTYRMVLLGEPSSLFGTLL